MNLQNRTIFCKDNFDVLKGINSNCIDLIYLDPPFNKKKIFSASIGSRAEGASFKDIFRKEDVKEEWLQTIREDNDKLHSFLESMKTIEGRTSTNFCYLAYMAVRLMEMHRVLKDTGSLYLHCDPTMSHYLKILMDIVFGEKNFRNEIVWYYPDTPGRSHQYFPKKTDHLFFYTKGTSYLFNDKAIRIRIKAESIKRYRYIRKLGGKEYLGGEASSIGKIPENVWQIPTVKRNSSDSCGYPTQKPLKLLERIISASSNEGDIVLDPFCGCATTCVASEKLGRQWVGVDVSVKAYELVKERLEKEVKRVTDNGQTHIENWDKEITYSTTPPKRTDTNLGDRLKKYVYIISHPSTSKANLYKVGIAKNLQSRLNSYQTGDPLRDYQVAFSLLTPYFREIEKHVHETFDSDHAWVMGTLEDLIKTIKHYRPKST